MFGSEAVDEIASVAQRGCNQNRSGASNGDVRRIVAWQLLQLRSNDCLYFARESAGSGDQKASGVWSVFSLRQEIGGNPGWIAAGGEHDGFGGPGEKIDGAVATDELLGGGYEAIAG